MPPSTFSQLLQFAVRFTFIGSCFVYAKSMMATETITTTIWVISRINDSGVGGK